MSLSSSLNRVTTAFRRSGKTRPAIVPSWTGYLSCEVLPLCVFVDCLNDNKYESLIISGDVPHETLIAHWLKLYGEYQKLLGDEEMTAAVMQRGHIAALEAKINQCKRLVNELYKGENKTFIELLKDWGYKLKCDSPEQYERELNRIVALLRGEEERLNKMAEMLAKEINKRIKESNGKSPRDIFIQQCASLTYFMKVQIILHDPKLMVADYCSYVKMMKQHYEAIKPKTANG